MKNIITFLSIIILLTSCNKKLTREDVDALIAEAKAKNKKVDLQGVDLIGVDLTGVHKVGASTSHILVASFLRRVTLIEGTASIMCILGRGSPTLRIIIVIHY